MPLIGDKKRSYEGLAQRKRNLAHREIGPPPDIVDAVRRDSCRSDLIGYLRTYHATDFGKPFSPDHLLLIEDTQRIILEGGNIVVAMPRGSGKTTIFCAALLWSSLYGHRRYPMVVCADDSKFRDMLHDLKQLLEHSERIGEDFPEVAQPIQALEQVVIRQSYQLCDGEPTHILWGSKRIRFPVTRWTRERGNAGITISGGGLTGAGIRGSNIQDPVLGRIRPDVVLIDDPQTRRSAGSPVSCDQREDIIRGDILRMAGPGGKPIAAMVACTVIYQGDVAERLLDAQRSPSWKSRRVATIKSWPTDMALWEKYDAVRRQELLDEVETGSANEFYRDHREAMDAGSLVYWEDRITEGKLSALQTAMDDWLENPRTFMAESQNQPEEGVDSELAQLDPLKLCLRVSTYPRGLIPAQCTTLTAHIDCQAKLLYWMVCAWAGDGSMGCYVVDYGTTPRVSSKNFTLVNIRTSLQKAFPGTDEPGAFRAAIKATVDDLSGRTWKRDDGAEMRLTRGLVDGRWRTDDVHAALRLSSVGNWQPGLGVGVRARDLPMAAYSKKAGFIKGDHWILHKPDRRQLVVCSFDTNFWKTECHHSLSVPIEHTGATTFFKAKGSEHQMLADHLVAEQAVRVEARGRTIDEWDNAKRRDNHYWDNLVGCRVAASLSGIRRGSDKDAKRITERRPRRKVRELSC